MKIKQYVQFVMKLVIVWDFKNYRKLNEFSKDGLHWLIIIILLFSYTLLILRSSLIGFVADCIVY